MTRGVPLADRLRRTAVDAADWVAAFADVLDRLRRAGVGAAMPGVGDRFPDFALPDPRGRTRSLSGLLGGAPLVLSVNRGAWCPFCRHELEAWSERLPDLEERGVGFAAVSSEVGGRAATLEAIFTGAMAMLCDVDHGLALELGLAFYVGEPLMRRYRDHGLDLAALYGSSSGLLPVPATFAIDADGTVLFAFADPDVRVRAEPDAVIAALDARRG